MNKEFIIDNKSYVGDPIRHETSLIFVKQHEIFDRIFMYYLQDVQKR